MPKKDFRKGVTVVSKETKKKYMFLGFGSDDMAEMYHKDDGLMRLTLEDLDSNYISMSASHKASREKRGGQMW